MLDARETLCLMPGATLQKPFQANLSDVASQESDSRPKRKEADKPEFEQWSNVTRFKNSKTAFQRDMIKDPAHPRWLAEIDQPKSYLDNAGAVFCNCQLSFSNPGSPNCERPRGNHGPKAQEKKSGGRRDAREEQSPDVDRKTRSSFRRASRTQW